MNPSTSTKEPMTLPVLKLRLKRNWPLFLQPPLNAVSPRTWLDLTCRGLERAFDRMKTARVCLAWAILDRNTYLQLPEV